MSGPRMPEAKPVVRIPQPDDPDIIAARQQAMQLEEENKKGRKSTNLTSGAGSAQPYTRTAMG